MASRNIEHLRENGPSTYDELPNGSISTYDRMNGVWKFDILGRPGGGGSTYSTGGQITIVYYLRHEHSKKAVVEKFLEVNPGFVEKKSRQGVRSMMRRQGTEWHDAIDEVFPATPGAGRAGGEA